MRYLIPGLGAAILLACADSASEAPAETEEPIVTETVTNAVSNIPDGMEVLDPGAIRDSYRRHAVQTQFRRWFQLYENPEVSLDNQLAILTGDARIVSGLGEAVGHDAYRARVSDIPREWKNAHFVRDTDITLAPDGSAQLVADVLYLNQGALPDGAIREAELTYRTQLTAPDGMLPRFESVTIEGVREGTAESYRDAYPENRVLSLVHYWLAGIEHPDRDPEPFRQMLLDDGFELRFSSGTITDFEGFKAWLAGPASAVDYSSHTVRDFAVEETAPNAYAASMVFDWQGLAPDGTELVARTRHNWTVEDNPSEAFARVKTVDVEVLTPFQPLIR